MRTFPDDNLLNFCDLISSLIKDYQYSIELIRKIKLFLQVSVRLVNSPNLHEAIKILSKNCNEVLSCEKTTIYQYDKSTNFLVGNDLENIDSGQRSKKPSKIPLDQGVVGWVFKNNQRQKIDDAYSDSRFTSDPS